MQPQVTVSHIHIFNECQGLEMQLRVKTAFQGAGSTHANTCSGKWFRCVDSAAADAAASAGVADARLLLLLLMAFEFSPFGRIWWRCFIRGTIESNTGWAWCPLLPLLFFIWKNNELNDSFVITHIEVSIYDRNALLHKNTGIYIKCNPTDIGDPSFASLCCIYIILQYLLWLLCSHRIHKKPP